jgi:hypothetical protein
MVTRKMEGPIPVSFIERPECQNKRKRKISEEAMAFLSF